MIDFGPDTFGWSGEAGVADLLACAGDYIDYAKIYACNALLMPPDVVKRVVRCYADAGVTAYSGGILFEYAHRRGEIDSMLSLLDRVGLHTLELSENYLTLSRDERLGFIDRFRRRGFRVIYEYGRKNPAKAFCIEAMAAMVAEMSALDVPHVIIEQSEIDMLVKSAPGALAEIAQQPWYEMLLIEADPYRFPQQHAGLLQAFGAAINLANVAPGQVLRLEGLRRGIGRAVDYSLLA